MFTTLSVVFIALLLAAIFYGFGIVMRRSTGKGEPETVQCSLCRRRYQKTSLVERQIGDYRLLYFCAECIHSLSEDAAAKKH